MLEGLKKAFQKEEKPQEIEEKERKETTLSTMESKTTVQAYKCLRCGHVWIPRKNEKPKVCPKCHSPYWDRPKEK